MSPVIATALLLLSATVVRSLEVQTDEEEDFPPDLKHDVRRRADQILQEGALPGSCCACKSIVSIVKKKLGSDHSKEKIERLLNNACNQVKRKLIRTACRYLVRKFKNKLINAIANAGTPRSICVKMKLCKRNKPVYR